MPQQETIDVTVRCIEKDITSKGNVWIKSLGRKDRLHRALKKLGLLWGLAIFSVMIPIAHFILVPGFLLAGPLVAIFTHRQTRIILGGECECPKCEQVFSLDEMNDAWPIQTACSQCSSQTILEMVKP